MRRDIEKINLRKEKVLSNIENVLNQVSTKKINEKDMDLLSRILDMIGRCYNDKVSYYLDSYRRDRTSLSKKSFTIGLRHEI